MKWMKAFNGKLLNFVGGKGEDPRCATLMTLKIIIKIVNIWLQL